MIAVTSSRPPAGYTDWLGSRDARDTIVTLAGLGAQSLVFVNGPEQPHELSLASARAAGADRLTLHFTNASDQPIRPAGGVYTVLVVDPAER